MKRTISLFLLVLILCGTFAACGNGDLSDETTVVTTAPVATEAPDSTTYVEPLEVPKDYYLDGYEFTILCTALMTSPPTPFAYKDTDQVLDEAVYRRNLLVEDEYGISIKLVTDYTTTMGAAVTRLQANRNSGDTPYDSGLIAVFDLCKLAYQGYLADMNDVPYVALEKSWWDQNATKDISINGKTYYTTGDISYLDKEYTFAVTFNKTIAAEKNVGDLYSLVRDGKWTLDAFAEMCRGVTEDLNGDDILDSRDKYGLILWGAINTAAVNASGNTIARIDDDKLVLTLNNEQVISVVDKFVGLAKEPCVINFQKMSGGVGWVEMFQNGQSLFLMQYLKALPSFRDTDLEYGILPFPKLSEEQDNYYCGLAGYQTSMYCIPVDIYDDEISGVITEALAYYSKEIVTPAYYDKTLIGRSVQDPESAETLDIIFANRIYDLGLFYRVGNLGDQMSQLLLNKSTDFSSMFEKYRIAAEMDIKRINEFFGFEE